jgi:membrane protease YdiL (CAAX protease family)
VISPSTSATSVRRRSSPCLQGSRCLHGLAVVVAFVVVLGAVESLLITSISGAGAGFGLLALGTCLLFGVTDRRTASVLPVLGAVAVVRLIMVSLVPAGDAGLNRLAIGAIPALAAVLAAMRICPAEWRRLRPTAGGWPMQAAIALVGVLLGVLILLLAPQTIEAPRGLPLVGVVGLFVLWVLPAELLFRGLLVPALATIVGRKDVAAAAVIYALTFVSWGLKVSLAALVVAAIMGWYRRRTGSVVGVVGAHVALLLIVYAFVNSSALV